MSPSRSLHVDRTSTRAPGLRQLRVLHHLFERTCACGRTPTCAPASCSIQVGSSLRRVSVVHSGATSGAQWFEAGAERSGETHRNFYRRGRPFCHAHATSSLGPPRPMRPGLFGRGLSTSSPLVAVMYTVCLAAIYNTYVYSVRLIHIVPRLPRAVRLHPSVKIQFASRA